jgi:hypothetical protein
LLATCHVLHCKLDIFIFHKTLFMQVFSMHFDTSKNIINQKVDAHKYSNKLRITCANKSIKNH